MIKPFKGSFPLTQGFGENPAIYAQFGMKGHNGQDYGLPMGTPLFASISGKVLETGSNPAGYGNYIKIENDKEGVLTAHMNSFAVKVGQAVKEGDPIGYSGNTGFSSGPHLHFAYFLKPRDRANGYDGWIDPQPHFTNAPTPTPTTDPRAGWFDLLSKTEFGTTGWEKLTQAQIDKWVKELPDRKVAGGKWDKLCDKAGIPHTTSVDEVVAKLSASAFDKTKFLEGVKKLLFG